MKKIIIISSVFIVSVFIFVSCAGLAINPTEKINWSYFSETEKDNFNSDVFVEDYNKLFYACVDVLQDKGYPIDTQSKTDNFIKAGPKSTMNGKYYITCSIRENAIGNYTVKWAFKIDAGSGVVATSEDTADAKQRKHFTKQWNYSVFCKLKNIETETE